MTRSVHFKTYWILYLAMMTVGMGQTVIFAVIPMLGRELGLQHLVFSIPVLGVEYQLKELAITILSSITALTFSVMSPFWGRMSDRIGRKPIILIGLLGNAFGMVLFAGSAYLGLIGFISGFWLYFVLVLTRIIHSSVMSASYPASNAFVVDNTDASSRAKGLGKIAATLQLGIMCGPALAYLMMFNFLTPFYAHAFLTTVMGVLILIYFPYHKREAVDQAQHKIGYFDSRYGLYLFLVLCVHVGLGMVQQTLGFYFQDILQLSGIDAAKQYSLSMVVSSAATLFAQLGFVQRLDWKPQTYIRLGIPFIAIGFIFIALADGFGFLALGMASFGFGMGLAGPSFAAAASNTVDANEQGALAGLIGSVAGMGFVIGPILGGFLYGFSPQYPYIASALVAGIAIILVMRKKLPGEVENT